jgi:hypothetical protein
VYIPLSRAVAQAHRRLFPDEPVRDPKTLQTIALAFTELMPIYRASSKQQLTEPELVNERFTESGMEELIVSKVRFDAVIATLQVTSLDAARVSLTMRQSPRAGARR